MKECNILYIILVQGFFLQWELKLLNFLMDSVLISLYSLYELLMSFKSKISNRNGDGMSLFVST